MGAQHRVEIGPATLYLGDNRAIVEPGWRRFACVSDPPYGMGWQPGKRFRSPRTGKSHAAACERVAAAVDGMS